MMTRDRAGAFGLAAAGSSGRIGRYEVVRRLAVGGMAELFLARVIGIEGFSKQVVIKRMLPQYASSPQMVEMFLDEARLAARLHHPNIAQVFDIGEERGEFFFTMEYVRGEDLGGVLRRLYHLGKPLPLEHSITIALGAAAGLHHAHEVRDENNRSLKIVHRDVSPSNIMVAYDGSVKLVDFGIAKARSRIHTTSSGGVKGKFSYMSPEQCRAEPLDRRSDIFSLGIVIYEMTTGMRLFDAENAMQAIQQVQSGLITPPSRTVAHYPPELERIVMRCLCGDPRERYQRTGEVQLDLESFARENKLAVSSLGLANFMAAIFETPAADLDTDTTVAQQVSIEIPLGRMAMTRMTMAAPDDGAPMTDAGRMTVAGAPSDSAIAEAGAGRALGTYVPSPTEVGRRTEAGVAYDSYDPGAGGYGGAAPSPPHRGVAAAVPHEVGYHASGPHPISTEVPPHGPRKGSPLSAVLGVLLGLMIGLGGAALAARHYGWFTQSSEASTGSAAAPAAESEPAAGLTELPGEVGDNDTIDNDTIELPPLPPVEETGDEATDGDEPTDVAEEGEAADESGGAAVADTDPKEAAADDKPAARSKKSRRKKTAKKSRERDRERDSKKSPVESAEERWDLDSPEPP